MVMGTSNLFQLMIYLDNERRVFVLNLELANRSILNCLELAAEKGEFIYTRRDQRRLGKSKALIQFAKENGYVVLVHSQIVAREFKKRYEYQFIKEIDYPNRYLDGLGPFVFDEGCSPAHINELTRHGFKIITGFMSEGPITD
jgi:hypothetical protein